MTNIFLPAITGQFVNWRYYQAIVKVKTLTEVLGYKEDATPIYRIKTVDEVDVIYSSSLNDMLQRVFDPKRLQPITNYLLKQKDRYINNLTIAIFGGEPEWLPIGLKNTTIELPDDDVFEETAKAFGIIKLSGSEQLFVLDGQHRIKSLREGIKNDNSLNDQEIAVTIISHKPTTQGKERTRRLFTVVNRYAKPVSLGESILLDEDDVSSIIVRNLIEEYPKFKGKNIIALNKVANLVLPKDDEKFSTVITLWNINEKLIDPKDVYPKYEGPKANLVRVRPEDKVIEREKKKIFAYWNLFFKTFPKASKFIESPKDNLRNNGGPISLRPIGQMLFINFYLKSLQTKGMAVSDIKKIPDNLENEFWHYVLYNPTSGTLTGTESYARLYVYYNLGYQLTPKEKKSLVSSYRKHHNDENINLPSPKFKKKKIK
jgi:DNA sulfur modification protein DndB